MFIWRIYRSRASADEIFFGEDLRKCGNGAEEDGGIIIYEKPQAYESLSMKGNAEASYVFKFKISEDAKKGTYKVKFKLDYRNTYKETFTREETAYFKVISEKTRPVLNISNIRRSVDKLKAGDTFTLSFDNKYDLYIAVYPKKDNDSEDINFTITREDYYLFSFVDK